MGHRNYFSCSPSDRNMVLMVTKYRETESMRGDGTRQTRKNRKCWGGELSLPLSAFLTAAKVGKKLRNR